MSASLILRACLYHLFGGFSDLKDIVNYWDPYFARLPYTVSAFQDGLSLALAWKGPGDADPHDKALWLLARTELENVASLFSKPDFDATLEIELNIEERLHHYSEEIWKHYKNIGLEIRRPEIYFVDDYPAPNNGKNFMAMTMAPNDLKNFDIPIGIYFKRNALRPFYSTLMLGHEFTHHILNRHSLPYFGGALEEGIAEFYGAFYLTSKLYSVELATRMFVYHRFFGDFNKAMDVYLDYARLGHSIYQAGGTQALETLLLGDRTLIKATEAQLWQGILPVKAVNVDESGEFSKAATLTFSAFSKLAVCSPLARYISKFVEAGVSFNDIANSSGFSKGDVIVALKELEGAPRFVELGENCVLHSDCERISHPLQLRYKVPLNAQSIK